MISVRSSSTAIAIAKYCAGIQHSSSELLPLAAKPQCQSTSVIFAAVKSVKFEDTLSQSTSVIFAAVKSV
ncbi:hypothetical protein OIU79_006597 [Salix purpurea]|uniref:Uncharacterized protein n=1 Tax=Salix purpurea TaxID=77065 RepID=A0A9Q0TW03_SALPP|nr:hypothetical protein OIU79_006597 [Salix purpurea]